MPGADDAAASSPVFDCYAGLAALFEEVQGVSPQAILSDKRDLQHAPRDSERVPAGTATPAGAHAAAVEAAAEEEAAAASPPAAAPPQSLYCFKGEPLPYTLVFISDNDDRNPDDTDVMVAYERALAEYKALGIVKTYGKDADEVADNVVSLVCSLANGELKKRGKHMYMTPSTVRKLEEMRKHEPEAWKRTVEPHLSM